jgi:hemolysin III
VYYGERFNGVTHLLGTALAVAGLVVLIVFASLQGDPWRITSVSIYGATLVTLYLGSTLYHSLRGRAKQVLQKIDHAAIYLLIAGTYTPFALVTLRGPWGWTLFGLVWGLALLGIVQELVWARGRRILSLVIYVLMGWLVLIAFGPLLRALPGAGVAWLVVGGLLYTGGIVFYALDKRLTHAHGVWHLFVMAGSACHFIAVLGYVI